MPAQTQLLWPTCPQLTGQHTKGGNPHPVLQPHSALFYLRTPTPWGLLGDFHYTWIWCFHHFIRISILNTFRGKLLVSFQETIDSLQTHENFCLHRCHVLTHTPTLVKGKTSCWILSSQATRARMQCLSFSRYDFSFKRWTKGGQAP